MAKPARKLENWLKGYAEFTENTESLPIFHLWVALGTLAGAAQRKIFLDMGHFQVHTNMFIVLTSRPGVGRKSTALRIGKGLLRGVKDYGVDVHFSTQSSSVAALIQQLSKIAEKCREHQSLTSFGSEIGSLLGTKSSEATDFLTDIFDCNPDWDKQTVGRGLEKIDKPWFNLISGTTPQWLGDNLSKTAQEGGFASRTVFVYGDEHGERIARPRLSEHQKQLRRFLTADLSVMSEIKGEFTLTEEAWETYTEWYEDPKSHVEGVDPRLAGYYERKHIQMLKVAMMLRMAEGTTLTAEDLIVQKMDIVAARGMLEEIEPGMHRAFTAVGKNVYGNDLERIREQITKYGKMTRRQLINANISSLEMEELDKLLATLIDMGSVKILDEQRPDKTITRFFLPTDSRLRAV